MGTNYPESIDTTANLMTVVDLFSPVSAIVVNRLRDAIIAIESTLGVQPGGIYTTVVGRISALENTVNNLNAVSLGGDLGNTRDNPYVIGIQGRPVSSVPPTINNVLIWDGIAWVPGSFEAALTAGGDLSGTYPNPTVAKIQTNPVMPGTPTIGSVYVWNGAKFVPQPIADISVSSSAAIQGTKISPNFGAQNIFTTGSITAQNATINGNLTVLGTTTTLSGLGGSGAGYATVSDAGLLGFTSTIPSGGITHGTAGQIFVTNTTPASVWTSLINYETTHGRFQSGGTGSDFSTVIGPLVGNETTYSAIWLLPNGTSPTANNYLAEGDGNSVYFNTRGGSGIFQWYQANANALMQLDGTNLQFLANGPANILWNKGIASPTVYQAAQTTDVATTNLTARAQYAYTSATGSHRTPGSLIFDIGAPTNSSTTEAYVQLTRNTTLVGQIGLAGTSGNLGNVETIWLGPVAGLVPTLQNWALASDGTTYTQINAVSTVIIGNNNSNNNMAISDVSVNIGNLSQAPAPVSIQFSTPTTPVIQSGTSATQLTVGTNNASGVLLFQTGTAAATAQLASNGPYTGALWLGNHTYTSGNFTLESDGSSTTVLNSPFATGNITFTIDASEYAVLSTTALTLGFNTASPKLQSDSSSTSLTVGTQNAAGVLNFQTGSAVTTASLSTTALFTVGGNGSNYLAAMGPRVSNTTTDSAFWLLPNGTSPNANNMVLDYNGSTLVINTPNGSDSIEFFTNLSTELLALNTTGTFLTNGYIGLNGTGATYPTIGKIRSDDNTNIIGANYSSTTYGLVSWLSGGLYLGSDNGFNSSVADVYVTAATAIDFVSNHVSVFYFTQLQSSPHLLEFYDVTTPYLLSMRAQTSNAATNTLTIQGQYAFSTASGTNRTAGDIILDVGSPTNSGTGEAAIQFSRNGTTIGQVQQIVSASQVGFWIGTTAPSSTNPAIVSDGNTFTYINAQSGAYIGFVLGAATYYGLINSQYWYVGNSTASTSPMYLDYSTAAAPIFHFGIGATTSATIQYDARTTDTSTEALTILGQNAYTSASTNTTGGDVFVKGGAGTSASTSAQGNIHLRVSPYTGGANDTTHHGWVTVEESTTALWRFGTYTHNQSLATMWGMDGGSPSTSNWVFYTDGANTGINAPSSLIYLTIANGAVIPLVLSSTDAEFGGGGTASTAPVRVNFSTTTTPLIIAGTSATSLTIGTNKANATLSFQAGAAATYATLTTTDLYLGSSATSSAAPIFIDWTTTTTPFIQSGTSATQLTIGTNKSTAPLIFQTGSAVTNMQLSTNGSSTATTTWYDYLGASQLTQTVNTTTDFIVWNVVNSGTYGLEWTVGASVVMELSSSSWLVGGSSWWVTASGTTVYFGSNLSSAGPLSIQFSTSTTPLIQAGTSSTSLTVGTDKNAATLVLQADSAVTCITLSGSSSSSAGTGKTSITGSLQQTTRSSSGSFTVDTTTTDNIIRVTATQTVTLPTATTGRTLEIWVDATGGTDVVLTLTTSPTTVKINNIATSVTAFIVTASADPSGTTGQVCKLCVNSIDGTNWWVSS